MNGANQSFNLDFWHFVFILYFSLHFDLWSFVNWLHASNFISYIESWPIYMHMCIYNLFMCIKLSFASWPISKCVHLWLGFVHESCKLKIWIQLLTCVSLCICYGISICGFRLMPFCGYFIVFPPKWINLIF
jgi:hypothetical protein